MKWIHSVGLLLLMSLFDACTPDLDQNHIFYLHGRIVEEQGKNAVHEEYGAYQYDQIIDSLKQLGKVHNEVRTTDTDFYEFAEKISGEINELIAAGVPELKITVVGASKGAVMAMYISHINESNIKYVLLGANNDALEQQYDWRLHGYVLGIYDITDEVAGKPYRYWKSRSYEAQRFQQIKLETGLGHGFLYQPLKEWLEPAEKWVTLFNQD
ncbi:MAG: hypothetical protein AAFO07_12890 [Bacteroidota bacterium]